MSRTLSSQLTPFDTTPLSQYGASKATLHRIYARSLIRGFSDRHSDIPLPQVSDYSSTLALPLEQLPIVRGLTLPLLLQSPPWAIGRFHTVGLVFRLRIS